MRPRLYAIPPERPFLQTLAEGLTARAGTDPLALSRVTVLLPTRRAVRALRDAFLRTAAAGKEPGTPTLLPRMRPIGDIEGDELSFLDDTATGDELTVPPAIPELRRQLLLTQLVLQWAEQGRRDRLLPGQAAKLAASLARLLDTVAAEGASFTRLSDLVPADLAAHWEVVRKLLEILPGAWPSILASEGAIDPAERRNRLLARRAMIWRRKPPRDPVIAAGLTGGIPAITELLRVVAGLEQGAVILAGLDRRCGSAEWTAIEQDEAHPQYLLASLLKELRLTPVAISDWPEDGAERRGTAEPRAERLQLIGEAMRPAATTDAWRSLSALPVDTLTGLGRYDCAGAHQEALTVALLLRRKLETPGATAALVTPDRELARRVAVELSRWGIAIDDSAGLPLNRTPPGVFLRLVLDLAASELAPIPLLAALKHPLAAGGLAPAVFRDQTRRLEQAIRGPRPAPGFAGLMRAVSGRRDDQLRAFVARLQACLGDFPDLLEAGAIRLRRLVTAHVEAAERLAATEDESGADRLWREVAGEVAARCYNELIDAAVDFPLLAGQHYPGLFEALSAGTVVRQVYGRHPRLAIWGLVEARLQQADLVVLGGLNEGSWPGAAAYDPWMSRQMRREFDIAVPERAIGIAAHDFVQALAAPEAALTRAARREGVPTVPSRWLLRLDAVLGAVRLDGVLMADPEIEAAAVRLDAARYAPLPPAAPRPPLAARPRQLSVTQIETWLADPYAIYARHILDLKALDELDADPGRADLGIRIHAVLAEFIGRYPREIPAEPLSELLAIGRRQFGDVLSRPGAWAFWWPRFERIASWILADEAAHRGMTVESFGELKGSLTLRDLPGGSFELTATADRIDRLASGEFLVIDYKTGALPAKSAIAAGLAPQLPLEALILRDGSFCDITGTPGALEYWKLGGRAPAGQRWAIDDGDPTALVKRAQDKLRALIERFDDPATPYLAVPVAARRPRFSDYEHLERVARIEAEEW
jgi:ATP-dependent helicase/nuclease subunit B